MVAKIDASGKIVDRYSQEPCGAAVDLEPVDGQGLTGNMGDPTAGLRRMRQWHMDSIVAERIIWTTNAMKCQQASGTIEALGLQTSEESGHE